MLVKKWMKTDVVTVNADDSMQRAIVLTQEHGTKILPVMDKGSLVGVVTDRDLKKASPSDATTLDVHEILYLTAKIRVRDIMAKTLYTIPPDYTIEEAAQLLMEKNIGGLPVVDASGALSGLISQDDIFRALIAITGLGKKGLQFAMLLDDVPGKIKDVRELIRKYGGRTASILSSTEGIPDGKVSVDFRIYDFDRNRLEEMVSELKGVGELLYVVDHRDNTRTIYAD